MRNTLLIFAVLALSSCATPAPPSLPISQPSPSVVQNPPPASTEGALSKSLQAGQDELRSDLGNWLRGTLTDLQESLNRARQSPPPSEPAKRSF